MLWFFQLYYNEYLRIILVSLPALSNISYNILQNAVYSFSSTWLSDQDIWKYIRNTDLHILKMRIELSNWLILCKFQLCYMPALQLFAYIFLYWHILWLTPMYKVPRLTKLLTNAWHVIMSSGTCIKRNMLNSLLILSRDPI